MASGIRLVTFPAITITTAGERKSLYEKKLLVYSVTIQSLRTNTGTQYFGDEKVDVSNYGAEVIPGDLVEVEPPDRARGVDQFELSDLYVTSSTAGAVIRVLAWIRGE